MKHAKSLLKCEECGLLYRERKWAERCEAYCRKHKSCSLEIIGHALSR
ncbi:MAG: hypothetical protein HYX24_05115 [Candidatus Aenigmarchaeota archaeon]|nr:hypothetical protein [Candidatus Aenigmarchaeota archaeon]